MGQMSTAGYAGLAAGEGWHYVGDEEDPIAPAFENGWGLEGYTTGLAFRLREPGLVDLFGIVKNSSASIDTIFTLPEGYRPTFTAILPAVGNASSSSVSAASVSGNVLVYSNGSVLPGRGTAGGTGLYVVLISGSIFINTP